MKITNIHAENQPFISEIKNDFDLIKPDTQIVLNNIKFKKLDTALTLTFESEILFNEHKRLMNKYSLKHSYNNFIAHISISYDSDKLINKDNISLLLLPILPVLIVEKVVIEKIEH